MRPAHLALLGLASVVGPPAVRAGDPGELVLVLAGKDVGPAKTWYRVRLPILPNNSTGRVSASRLGDLTTIHTHLYIDRAKLTATLWRDGRIVFKTRVGIGRAYWPTPRGEFYIRDSSRTSPTRSTGPSRSGRAPDRQC